MNSRVSGGTQKISNKAHHLSLKEMKDERSIPSSTLLPKFMWNCVQIPFTFESPPLWVGWFLPNNKLCLRSSVWVWKGLFVGKIGPENTWISDVEWMYQKENTLLEEIGPEEGRAGFLAVFYARIAPYETQGGGEQQLWYPEAQQWHRPGRERSTTSQFSYRLALCL